MKILPIILLSIFIFPVFAQDDSSDISENPSMMIIDPIELTSEQWGFIYQLIILTIGGITAVKLVPYFTNKYQEKQKEIDRSREDNKQQLQIQHDLIDKASITISRGLLLVTHIDKTIAGKKIDFSFEQYREFLMESNALDSIFELYYGSENEICKTWEKLTDSTIWAIDELNSQTIKSRSEYEQKKELQELLDTIKTDISFDEAIKILKNDGVEILFGKLLLHLPSFFKMISNTAPTIHRNNSIGAK